MDDELRARFKRLIDERAEGAAGSLPVLEKRIARRRAASVAAMSLVAVSVAGGSFVAAEGLLRRGSAPSDDSLLTPADAMPREGRARRGEQHVIASGVRDGRAWELRGSRAEPAGGRGPASLCLEWVHPPVDTGGMACTTDLTEGLPPGELVVAQTVDDPLFGEVAPEVDRLEVHAEDGTVTLARIVDAPAALGVPYDFFVGFGGGPGDVTLVAKDSDGNVLERERHPALPLLLVTKEGDGSGYVAGYSTGEARCGPTCPSPSRWIDCGETCRVELDDALITLEASPDAGSVFAGWSGACEGTTTCTITVDSDRVVTARFDRVP